MKICHCRDINSQMIKAALEENPDHTLRSLYRACTGGQNPDCGTCLKTMQDFRQDHQTKPDNTHEQTIK